jgi:hypothetical protein
LFATKENIQTHRIQRLKKNTYIANHISSIIM